MAFTFTNYQPSSLNELPYHDILGKILGGYTDTTKAQLLKPTLEEELTKAKLFNQYYAPNIESEIGLRKAQTGEAGARTGLIGEQTRGMHLENQYIPEYKRAQIEQLKANSEKARLLQMIRESLFSGGVGQGMPQQGLPSLSAQNIGQGMPNMGEQMPSVTQQPSISNMPSYAQAAIAGQALGLGMPKIVESNGKYMAISPFGAIDTGVHGLTEQQKALAKKDAEKISQLEQTVINSEPMSDNLQSLNSILGSPQFEALRQNPILGRHELGWYKKFGTKEQQDLIGQAQTFMGNIIKASARDFPGQFRIGEQALLNDMKPNEADSIDTMKGKAGALTYLNTIMTKRAELEADYMRNSGMSALQARIAADRQINPKEIRKEIHTILHPASNKKSAYSQEDLEYTARKHNMTVDEVRQKLGGR